MTKEENIQRIKNETLNRIRKYYHPKYKSGFTYYDGEGSWHEQMSYRIQEEIEQLEINLKKAKNANK